MKLTLIFDILLIDNVLHLSTRKPQHMNKNSILSTATTLVLLFIIICTVTAYDSLPYKDTFTGRLLPLVPHGGDIILNGDEGNQYIYLAFKNTPYPNVATATLSLYCGTLSAVNRDITVRQVTGTWTENGLTYSNSAALRSSATLVSTKTVPLAVIYRKVTLDVTSAAQSAADFTVQITANGDIFCSSKEHLVTYRPSIAYTVSCPENCNGHGTCNGVVCSCDGNWDPATNCGTCKTGFNGPNCDQLTCPGDCNGHGTCNNGVCTCDGNWDPVTNCASCKSGFTGASCDQMTCPGDCNEHGTCNNGVCSCDGNWDPATNCASCKSGFTGASCDQMTCPGDCYGHGTCNNGVCSCQGNWDPATNCQNCKSTYTGPTCSTGVVATCPSGYKCFGTACCQGYVPNQPNPVDLCYDPYGIYQCVSDTANAAKKCLCTKTNGCCNQACFDLATTKCTPDLYPSAATSHCMCGSSTTVSCCNKVCFNNSVYKCCPNTGTIAPLSQNC
jgi:hypothetical protein